MCSGIHAVENKIHNSFIVGKDITGHTFVPISILPRLSNSGCSNLCHVGGVKMITTTPVAMERDRSRNRTGEAIANDPFTDMSMLSSFPRSSGPNLWRCSSVEMVTKSWIPVSIERNGSCHSSSVDETLGTFWSVAMFANFSCSSCSNFVAIFVL